jgi:hypothetical protein
LGLSADPIIPEHWKDAIDIGHGERLLGCDEIINDGPEFQTKTAEGCA